MTTTDKAMAETKVDQSVPADIDAILEETKLVVDHTVSTAKVQTQKTDMDYAPWSEAEDAVEALARKLAGYPHSLLPADHVFDPYLSAVSDSEFCHVDEDYLLKNLHERPTLDMSTIKWQPQEIPDFETTPRMEFDIESTGLDPNTCETTMVGIFLRGDFGNNILNQYRDYFEMARTGGLIFTYNNDTHLEPFPVTTATTIAGGGLVIEEMETTVPDGKGFKKVTKQYGVRFCRDEADMLGQMWAFINSIGVKIVTLHYGYEFDCPFLTTRSKILGVPCPWTTVLTTDRRTGLVAKKLNTAAAVNGKPLEYFPTYWAKPNAKGQIWNDGSFPQIIDTLHLAGQEDKLSGSMLGYGLKYLAAEYIGGRDGRRTELSYTQMLEAWEGGNPDKLKTYREYLIYDLEDQGIVAQKFMKNVWEQMRFMPLPLQEISVASPARKWSGILTQVYKPCEGQRITRIYNGVAKTITLTKPQPDSKVRMEGAISRVSPGMYRNFYKVDVASLYPSIMLRWVLADERKDPLGLLLYILIQARTLRYHYKAMGNTTTDPTKKATYKSIDAALKVLLNGAFGACGTGGYGYNSMLTAALIMAYGRIMMRIMMHVCSRYHRIIECFTGDTLITTRTGVFAICDIIDQPVEVVNGDGDWSPVTFTLREEESEIYQVNLKRGTETRTVRCNGAHRWYAAPLKNNQSVTQREYADIHTKDMIGGRFAIPYLQAPKPNHTSQDYINGVVHGIIYGDGHLGVQRSKTMGYCYITQLVGDKEMLDRYFDLATNVTKTTTSRIDTVVTSIRTRCYSWDELKKLPNGKSNEYLLGFTHGLIATDGSVDVNDGTVDIAGTKDTVEFIQKIGEQIGMPIGRVNISNKAGRTTVIRGVSCTQKIDCYKAFFMSTAICADDLLRPFHQDKYALFRSVSVMLNKPWKITSVVKTLTKEDVYCCVEPTTHSFMLFRGIQTKNCDTDGILLEVTTSSGPADKECVRFVQSQIAAVSDKVTKLEVEGDTKALQKAIDLRSHHLNQLTEMLDTTRGERIVHTPEFVHYKMQEVLPSGDPNPNATEIEKVGIVLELEEMYPDGVIFAPKAKNYIKFSGPDKKPSVKGIYRKRNRTPLQKEHLIEYIRIRAFVGVEAGEQYINAVLNAIRTLSVSLAAGAGQAVTPSPQLDSGDYTVALELKDITSTQRIPSNGKWLTECNMGEAGGDEKVSFYWGHLSKRGKPTKKEPQGRSIKGKEFPIRVIIGDDWSYEVNPQFIPTTFDRADISFALDHTRYELNFLKSVAEINEVIAVGDARTSMTIEDADLKLPEWYIEELDMPF